MRLTGCSGAWPRMRPGRTYRVGQVRRAPEGTPERTCTECEHEHHEAARVRAATGSSEGYDAIRRRNVEVWLRPALLDPSMRDTVEALYAARKEYYRQVRTGAGPGSLAECVVLIRGLAVKLRTVHRYEGSMVLLNDWRRAGYDMETLLGLSENVRPRHVS